MEFDFDRVIERRGSRASKWDAMEKLFGVSPDDGIPMWVADMDFAAPEAINEALRQAADHGVYGYYAGDQGCKEAMGDFYQRRHGWRPEPAHVAFTHGLVNGASVCVEAFTEPGDGVILFTPVYHAFHRVLGVSGRRIVQSEMVERDGRYEMDLETLAGQLDGTEKVALFCSPHNPGGRCWTREEIRALADFCAEHGLILVSDEIHCDLVLPGAKHVPSIVAAPEHADRIVTMIAATKTFNIAGAHTGAVVIPDKDLKARFDRAMLKLGLSPNMLGMVMIEAAWRHGDAWLDALIAYLEGNRQVFDAGIEAIPGLRSMRLEGTYLAWVDFSGTGMERKEFSDRVLKQARIAPSPGVPFGKGGENWMRFNFATPRARVQEAVERLGEAFGDLQ